MVDRYPESSRLDEAQWLKPYYLFRAIFSGIWVALALSVGRHNPAGAAVLLVVYPAWDAFANFIDMSRSGGMHSNRTQAVNVAISAITTGAVFLLLNAGMSAVLTVFGIWAILSGALQLGTAVRRWKHFGAQWVMVLSGAQSALAGALFIAQSHAPMPAAIVKISGYATVGAVYFLISAIWLHVREMRRNLS
ncbi:DUF308 domain-containing protein [Burkholderia dolosa]|uniref:DUF308 domain-containing protein n=1 Tax=Burkholderia dolosa TaxID=152500 RepID=UPI001B923B7B|nr:DUF308 domain-containing protein [Burkholderia dolosa]MBR8459732.1 DUF308 domain-containing protein [Burkholderia dolosa]MDN7423957.1 DUF308 domain-containing protein [Burkholderia dolosa]